MILMLSLAEMHVDIFECIWVLKLVWNTLTIFGVFFCGITEKEIWKARRYLSCVCPIAKKTQRDMLHFLGAISECLIALTNFIVNPVYEYTGIEFDWLMIYYTLIYKLIFVRSSITL